MTGEPQRIFLGVIATEPDETIAFAIPADLDAATIKAALAAAEAEKAAAQARESERLRKMFLDEDKPQ